MEGEEKSYRVGSAGDGDGEAVAGFDLFAREREARSNCHASCYCGRFFQVAGMEFEWRKWFEGQCGGEWIDRNF